MLPLILVHTLGAAAVAAGAWFWRDHLPGRALAAMLAGLAGALIGLDIGVQFPVGDEPHFRAIIGGYISGGRGLLLGFVVLGCIGLLVSRRPGWTRFAASILFIVAFMLATVPMSDLYWTGRFGEVLRLTFLVAVTPQ